jgi:sulfide:quinone oxidoreductase
MRRTKVLVLGSSFAGMTAAIEIKKKLADRVDVSVISKSNEFLFMPSLIWVPFGVREPEAITFDLVPVFAKADIDYRQDTVTRIDLSSRCVVTEGAHEETYDYLVIATGPELGYDEVPGLGPYGGSTQSIFSLDAAMKARDAYEAFLKDPGPVVVGAVQGASCFGAVYEFLLNFAYHLKKQGLADKAPLTYVTPEPYLGHFGMGGFGNHDARMSGTKLIQQFFDASKIEGQTNARVERIEPGEITLHDGRRLPFAYAMLAPAFRGVPAVRALGSDVVDARGFVKVSPTYQLPLHPEVYAAGECVSLPAPEETQVPWGVPKTGYLSEEMAKVVAHNIAADLRDEPMLELPASYIDAKDVLDAGDTGIIISADHFLEPRKSEWLIPGPQGHWAKLAFEKFFLATHKRGMV